MRKTVFTSVGLGLLCPEPETVSGLFFIRSGKGKVEYFRCLMQNPANIGNSFVSLHRIQFPFIHPLQVIESHEVEKRLRVDLVSKVKPTLNLFLGKIRVAKRSSCLYLIKSLVICGSGHSVMNDTITPVFGTKPASGMDHQKAWQTSR